MFVTIYKPDGQYKNANSQKHSLIYKLEGERDISAVFLFSPSHHSKFGAGQLLRDFNEDRGLQ